MIFNAKEKYNITKRQQNDIMVSIFFFIQNISESRANYSRLLLYIFERKHLIFEKVFVDDDDEDQMRRYKDMMALR